MKNTLLVLCALSIAACSTPQERRNAQINRVNSVVLDNQVAADKAHNVFVSRNESEKTLYMTRFEFMLTNDNSMNESVSILTEYLMYETDEAKAIEWANALTKYRFAIDEGERLELMHSLIAASFAKGDFKQTEKILDCKKNMIKPEYGAENDEILISFHPAINITTLLDENRYGLSQNVYSQKEGNGAINNFYSMVRGVAKLQHKKSIRGILYAWLPSDRGEKPRSLQYCDITIPL